MNAPTAHTLVARRRFLGRMAAFLAGTALLGRPKRAQAASQSLDPYLGEIALFAGNFAPRGWAFCNGQLLPINQNQALFAILGTTYGGNGQTTFALPDLRNRVPIHQGQGPGLTNRVLGEVVGAASHTLLITELPAHSHVLRGSSAVGTVVGPAGAYAARNAAQIPQYGTVADVAMASTAIGTTGASQPHDNHQPCLAVNFIIALQGVFPSP
jgi:microcystin-dependent protein